MTTILFGGGDGGGLIITANGVRRIPPFDPYLSRQLKAISLLSNSFSPPNLSASRREQEKLVTKLCNLAVEQVEQVVGPLDAGSQIVYDDDGGGFYCGTTGKPPIPIPPRDVFPPLVRDMLAKGDLDSDILQFSQRIRESGGDLAKALNDPVAAAKTLNVSLSEASVKQLRGIAPARLKEVKDPVDKQILGLFHAVLADGRYLDTWSIRPAEIADNLGVKLDRKAIERIKDIVAVANNPIGDPIGPVSNPVAIAVVVGVVIMLVPTEAGRTRLDIQDFSRIAKF